MAGQNFSDQYIFSNMRKFLTVQHVNHGGDFLNYLPYSSFMSVCIRSWCEVHRVGAYDSITGVGVVM